jgi:Sulfotransferase family
MTKPTPAFLIILAPPRSYTSLVCAMAGQHPNLYGLPELNLFVAETMREREGLLADRLFADHGLLRTVAELFLGGQSPLTIALARRWLRRRSDRTWREVFEQLAAAVAPRHLVEKSPRTVLHVERMQRVRRAFPEVRFVHLLRHPRAQGESMWQLGGVGMEHRLEDDTLDRGTDPPTIDLQRLWYRANLNIVTFLDGVPKEQWLRLRGEDMLRAPERHLAEVAELMGVRADEDAVDAMLHPERSPYAAIGPRNARFGNDPKFLRSPEFRGGGGGPERGALRGPLPWRADGTGFTAEVVGLAREFGYS